MKGGSGRPDDSDTTSGKADRLTWEVEGSPINRLTGPSAVRQTGAVMNKILGHLKDEQGIETLEWIAVGALIVAVALVVYPGTLQGGLQTVVQAITDKLTGIIT